MKLLKRLITGTLLFWLILFTIFKGGLIFNIAILLVSLLNLYELNHVKGLKFSSFPSLFLLFCYSIVFYLFMSPIAPLIAVSLITKLLVAIVCIFGLIQLSSNNYFIKDKTFLSYTHSLLLMSIGFPFLILIRQLDQGLLLCLFMFIVVSSADTVAYFIGKYFGRHKISIISPKKTWEGSLSGIFSSAIVSYIFTLFFLDITFINILLLGILISIVAQCGDFYESLIKRSYSVKDSSTLLPGHGGFFDRTDSYIFLFPLIYYFHSLIL